MQALFGKRPTEKDPAKGTSPAVDFTLRAAGGEIPPADSPDSVSAIAPFPDCAGMVIMSARS